MKKVIFLTLLSFMITPLANAQLSTVSPDQISDQSKLVTGDEYDFSAVDAFKRHYPNASPERVRNYQQKHKKLIQELHEKYPDASRREIQKKAKRLHNSYGNDLGKYREFFAEGDRPTRKERVITKMKKEGITKEQVRKHFDTKDEFKEYVRDHYDRRDANRRDQLPRKVNKRDHTERVRHKAAHRYNNRGNSAGRRQGVARARAAHGGR